MQLVQFICSVTYVFFLYYKISIALHDRMSNILFYKLIIRDTRFATKDILFKHIGLTERSLAAVRSSRVSKDSQISSSAKKIIGW